MVEKKISHKSGKVKKKKKPSVSKQEPRIHGNKHLEALFYDVHLGLNDSAPPYPSIPPCFFIIMILVRIADTEHLLMT